MKKSHSNTKFLGAFLLLLGSSTTALAVDYSGTLDFKKFTVPVSIPTIFGTINNAGFDLVRYDLGSGLTNPAAITLTTHNSFNTGGTFLGVLFATDPNDALFNNPTSLSSLITPGVDVTAFLNTNVIGWTLLATNLLPNVTTDISARFTPPLSFDATARYYAFVAGGSAINPFSNQLTDNSVGYTLSVTAVPEPGAWAMLAVGLGLVALRVRRRAGAALA